MTVAEKAMETEQVAEAAARTPVARAVAGQRQPDADDALIGDPCEELPWGDETSGGAG